MVALECNRGANLLSRQIPKLLQSLGKLANDSQNEVFVLLTLTKKFKFFPYKDKCEE